MTDISQSPGPASKLANDLLRDALDGSEHPAEAVSALMWAAATILQRSFGKERALGLMLSALAETRSKLPSAAAH